MNDIYYDSIQKIEGGASFYIDFKTLTLKVDKKTVIRNGKHKADLGIEPIDDKNEFFESLNNRFDLYYRSIPSENSESHYRVRFRAKKLDELTKDEFLVGVNRELARFCLEYFILASIINGSFAPHTDITGWFYQGHNKAFIIQKDWFPQP